MQFDLVELKQNSFSIHEKINFRANYTFYRHCIDLRVQLLTKTNVGTLLMPYEHIIYNHVINLTYNA